MGEVHNEYVSIYNAYKIVHIYTNAHVYTQLIVVRCIICLYMDLLAQSSSLECGPALNVGLESGTVDSYLKARFPAEKPRHVGRRAYHIAYKHLVQAF